MKYSLNMKNFAFWICLGLLSYPLCVAQTDASEAGKISGRKAWVVAAMIPGDVDNPLQILIGDKLEEVRLYTRSVGHPVKIDPTGIVRGVKAVMNVDGEEVYENLFISTVPEGVREALIILVPKAEDAGGLRFRSKVIDLSNFKEGGILYVNLVKTKLGIRIGEERVLIEPGGMNFINPLNDEEKGVFTVGFYYEIPTGENEGWKLMNAGKMAIYSSRREICVFFYNEEIENVDFRGIPFMVPLPKIQPKDKS